MKREGITVVFISHRLKEVKEIADRIVVLRDGKKVFQGRAGDLTESEIAELMIGRELSEMYPEKPEPSKETILSVRNLSSACGRVRKVSFDLKRGEILGFYGLVGAGRTELMETILGIRKKVEGEIFLRGERVEISSPDEARRLGIVYLPEDRKSAGIIGILEAYKNVTLMNLKKYSRFLLRKRLEFEAFELYRKRFSIRARGPRQLVRTLSGGNQQKVVISKLVDTGSKIFIFDEPTRGVDVNAKHQIYEIMRRLVDELGATFVVVSSELPEIIGISNRVVVMRNGRIVAQVEGEELNERDLIYYATGVREGSGV